jgi:pimeloyl-ACP methyl ester carboxylesterase
MLLLAFVAQPVSPHHGWAPGECPAREDTVRTRCGRVEVAEDRSRPDGRTIRLFVVRRDPVRLAESATEPIVFLDGGPGRSAYEDAWWAELVLGRLAGSHPLVFMDQRGTGFSARLDCDLWPERRVSDRLFPAAALRRCQAKLAPKAALDRYGTSDVVMDLEAVRRALGVERLNLYGVSYGARVATAYAVLFPERVRSLVLHSAGFGAWPAITADASRRVLQLAAPSRGRDAPDRVLRGLEASPLDVPFELGSFKETVRVGPRVGAWLLRSLLYDAGAYPRIRPLMAAFRNRVAGDVISRALSDFARGEDNRSTIAFFGVTCTEDIAVGSPSEARDWASVPLEDLEEACREWPRAALPQWWGRAPPSTVPTLLLSGSRDPVTPADSAVAFARRMGGAHPLIVEGGGHGGSWTCTTRAVEKFVVSGSSAGLPATCSASSLPSDPLRR